MSSGQVHVGMAWSTVQVQVSGLSDELLNKVKYMLGETFGEWMVKKVSDNVLEVRWYSTTQHQIPPEKLKRQVHQALEQNAKSLAVEVSMHE